MPLSWLVSYPSFLYCGESYRRNVFETFIAVFVRLKQLMSSRFLQSASNEYNGPVTISPFQLASIVTLDYVGFIVICESRML